MKTGDMVLIPFPFAELTNKKVRPAVVICETKDKYKDIVVCAISSVLPTKLSANEILLKPNLINNLRVVSIIKVDRIITTKKEELIHKLGKLNSQDLIILKQKFHSLIDN
jgi:mRNA interferase MazF